ncbi:MAG: hypothetical protein ACIAXF_00220 [Phycisphaerales bacterium JB063]
MPMRFTMLATMLSLLLCGSTDAHAQRVGVTLAETFGQTQPDDRIGAAGADRIRGLHWVDGDLIVTGNDGRTLSDDVQATDDGYNPATGDHLSRFVYRVSTRTGERLWQQRYTGDHGRTTVSPDDRHVLVQLDTSGLAANEDDTAIARVLDARTGETHTDVLHRDVSEAVRRDAGDTIDTLAFGPRRGEVVMVFQQSEEDARRANRVDNQGQTLIDTHGTRAYRYHWQRRRRVGRAFMTDPGPIEFSLSPDGTLLGYVAPLHNVICVYGVQAQRDRVLAGQHQTRRTEPDEPAAMLDAPFYSGIQINNTHAVVARDAPGGPDPAMLFVINLTNGQVEARIESPGGHLVFDVDFDRERIAVTGSARHLAVYDFAGNELYFEEDATPHRNHAIAISSNGRRIALGGHDNLVRVYNIDRR